MENWLEPVKSALEGIKSQVTVFFRDDDAGWCYDRLFKLIDCFSEYALPLDLAAIPQEFDVANAASLRCSIEASEHRIGIHQHGFRHLNHQQNGRKCEFGQDRSLAQQKFDIWMGKSQLNDYFGDHVSKIFTPPWNRCNQDTVEALIDLEFTAISRDETAQPLKTGPLIELSVGIDWFKKKAGVRLEYNEIGSQIGAAIWKNNPLGLMLHHAEMDRNERSMLKELLALLHSQSNVKCEPMSTLIESRQFLD